MVTAWFSCWEDFFEPMNPSIHCMKVALQARNNGVIFIQVSDSAAHLVIGQCICLHSVSLVAILPASWQKQLSFLPVPIQGNTSPRYYSLCFSYLCSSTEVKFQIACAPTLLPKEQLLCFQQQVYNVQAQAGGPGMEPFKLKLYKATWKGFGTWNLWHSINK